LNDGNIHLRTLNIIYLKGHSEHDKFVEETWKFFEKVNNRLTWF